MEKLTLDQYEQYVAKLLIEVDKDLDQLLVQLVDILSQDRVEELLLLKRPAFRIKLIKDHEQQYLLSKHTL